MKTYSKELLRNYFSGAVIALVLSLGCQTGKKAAYTKNVNYSECAGHKTSNCPPPAVIKEKLDLKGTEIVALLGTFR
ncbi:hypothetical protein [Dyadobacter pollutisoli]|uniref:hypothetical protein n=1 Tax=Dyadobacter pollutisoli TaxID=2910158 RepID=UPI001FD48BC1|nr:hypothetical protein [Dyadobacter pollutisoli]